MCIYMSSRVYTTLYRKLPRLSEPSDEGSRLSPQSEAADTANQE